MENKTEKGEKTKRKRKKKKMKFSLFFIEANICKHNNVKVHFIFKKFCIENELPEKIENIGKRFSNKRSNFFSSLVEGRGMKKETN